MKLFVEKYKLNKGVRFSMLPYMDQEKLVNLPLYTAFAFKTFNKEGHL